MSEDDPTYLRAFGMLKAPKETERRIQVRLCKYMKAVNPRVRFLSTLDGEHFGEFQAQQIRAIQWGRGAPDLLIFAPRAMYCGLALELKKEDVYKKDGNLKAGDHLREQSEWLDYLEECGWYARFGCGYAQAEQIIRDYLNLR